MKKMIIALFIMLSLSLSLGQGQALAASDCLTQFNTGAATTIPVFYESNAAIYGWSGGVITNDMYYNKCGEAAAIKVNMDDWNKLLAAGKLDGLRYIYKPKDGAINLRKIAGTERTNIKPEDFFS